MNRSALLRGCGLFLMLGLHMLLDAYAEHVEAVEEERAFLRAERDHLEEVADDLEAAPRPLCDCGRPWPCDCGDLNGDDLDVFAQAANIPMYPQATREPEARPVSSMAAVTVALRAGEVSAE